MKKIIHIIILISLCSLLAATVTLKHNPPLSLSPGSEQILTLEVIEGIDDVDEVNLFYRQFGSQSFISVLMTRDTGIQPLFTAQIPDIIEQGIEYYFEVKQLNGSIETLPASQPDLNPYRLQAAAAEAPSDDFILLSPDSPSVPENTDFIIAVSYFAMMDEIDVSTIQVLFDGNDITERATITGNMLSLRMEKVPAGRHSFQIKAETMSGKPIVSRSWQTKVSGREAVRLPMNMTGHVRFTGTYDNTDYDKESDDNKRGDWDIKVKSQQRWFNMFTKLYLTSEENSDRQPLNRYTFGIQVPHFELLLGDDSPYFDSFTMNNKNVRGIHGDLNLDGLRLKVLYGESKRQIDGEYVENTDGTHTIRETGTFKRNTFGFRTEAGTRSTFLWGLSVVKNKDERFSLDEKEVINSDGVHVNTPKDNLVIGTDMQLATFRRAFVLGAEAAVSFYNRDTYDGAMTKDELNDYLYGEESTDEFPLDPESVEDLIVINKNMEPIEPGKSSLALRLYSQLRVYRNFLSISYSEIGSAYNSLSASYLQNDASVLSVTDNVTFWDNQIQLALGVNWQEDNLAEQKESTNESLNWFTQLTVGPRGLPALRLGYSISTNENDAEEIESKLDQTVTQMNFGLSYDAIGLSAVPTLFSVGYDVSNGESDMYNNYEDNMSTISLSAVSRFRDLPVKTVLQFSTTSQDFDQEYNNPIDDPNNASATQLVTEESNTAYNTLYGRMDWKFIEDRLKPFWSISWTTVSGDSDSKTNNVSLDKTDTSQDVFNTSIGTSYMVIEDLDTMLSFGLRNFTDNELSDNDYSRYDVKFKASYRF